MRREQIGGCCRSTGLGIVALRRSWREIFLWKTGDRQKEKRSKKERNGGLWKLTPLMEIRSPRGFPQRLGKHKTLSTVPTRPDGGSIIGFTFLWPKDGSASNIKTASVPISNCLNRRVHPIGLCPILCPPRWKHTPSKAMCKSFRINERQQSVFHSHGWAEGPSETRNYVMFGLARKHTTSEPRTHPGRCSCRGTLLPFIYRT